MRFGISDLSEVKIIDNNTKEIKYITEQATLDSEIKRNDNGKIIAVETTINLPTKNKFLKDLTDK